jgi:hypothetical protein
MLTVVGAQIFKSGLLSCFLLFTSTLGVCQTLKTPGEPSEAERTRMAETFLQERLSVWQERLSLKNWTIYIVISRPDGLRNGTLGNIRWDMDKRTAVIRVLDPADYKTPFRTTLKDMEFTVVHELIHLEFASLPRSEESRSEEEHAVNHVAEALLKLDRKE